MSNEKYKLVQDHIKKNMYPCSECTDEQRDECKAEQLKGKFILFHETKKSCTILTTHQLSELNLTDDYLFSRGEIKEVETKDKDKAWWKKGEEDDE